MGGAKSALGSGPGIACGATSAWLAATPPPRGQVPIQIILSLLVGLSLNSSQLPAPYSCL